MAPVSTDANDMGGFFMRKLAGAAGVGLQLCKMWPMVRSATASDTRLSFAKGHYRGFVWVGAVVDASVFVFLSCYRGILIENGAWDLPRVACVILLLETLLWTYYGLTGPRRAVPSFAAVLPQGKTPGSLPSNIVARTVVVVSSFLVLTSVRDLIAPGCILSVWLRDDVYLEWTNAFFHSPPPGSQEWEDYSTQSSNFIGDKYIAQLAAVFLLGISLYKFVGSCGGVRWGSDGSGLAVSSILFWQGPALASLCVFCVLRVFANAAASASWNLQWHLMAWGYETFIVGLYGFC